VIEPPRDSLTFGLEVASVRRQTHREPLDMQVCAAVSLLLLHDVIAVTFGLSTPTANWEY
jgi:hypothetical protein